MSGAPGTTYFIDNRFKLSSIKLQEAEKVQLKTLINNGLYYLQINNIISALVSFSNAATYVYAKDSSATETIKALLGYVEKLQEDAQKLSTTSSKPDEKQDWQVECKDMCEMKDSGMCIDFSDVIGMTREKGYLETSIIKPLVYPNLFTKSSKGVLLYGPPGTGKTYLVTALVKQLQKMYKDTARVLFFSLTGADLKGKYVGETEKRIVKAYTCAARRACQATDPFTENPCLEDGKRELKKIAESDAEFIKGSPQYVSILFIDEFDSIGGDRSTDTTGLVGNSVNTLLQMMDGIGSYKNVITVAATNYPWSLDSALLRRFNEHIYCKMPTYQDIKKIVDMEIKSRIKIEKKNKRDYCLTDINKDKKIFEPSEQLKQSIISTDRKEGCPDKIINYKSYPFNMIDFDYMQDNGEAMKEALVAMAEKVYSNSDISSVMKKAFDKAAEAAIQHGQWKTVSHVNETVYGASCTTKLLSSTENYRRYNQGSSQLQKDAAKPSPLDIDNIIIVPDSVYIDKEGIKPVMPVPEDELSALNLKQEEYHISNIQYDNEVYINIRFIKDLPPILLFNDYTIGDMFFKESDIQNINRIAKNKVDTTIDSLKISMIFTKIININNKPAPHPLSSVISDIKEQLVGWENKTPRQQMNIYYEFNNTITNMIKKGLDSSLIFGKILECTDCISLINRWVPGIEPNDKCVTCLSKFASSIDNISDITSEEQLKIIIKSINTDENLGLLRSIGKQVNINDYRKLVDKIVFLNSNGFNILTEDDEMKLIEPEQDDYDISPNSSGIYTKQFQYITEDKQTIIKEIFSKYRPLGQAETVDARFKEIKLMEQIKAADISKLKKIFYFKSNIKPFTPSWVEIKSGGCTIINSVKESASAALTQTYSWFSKIDKVNKAEDVLSYLSNRKIGSVANYLLKRATEIGVCDGINDIEFIKKPVLFASGTSSVASNSDPGTPGTRTRSSSATGGGKKTESAKTKKTNKRTNTNKTMKSKMMAGAKRKPVSQTTKTEDPFKIFWFSINGLTTNTLDSVLNRTLIVPIAAAFSNRKGEDNIWMKNAMTAEIFNNEDIISYDVSDAAYSIKLPIIFKINYTIKLPGRKEWWQALTSEYAKLIPLTINSRVNIKDLIINQGKIPSENLLNFSIGASFILSAIDEYPSSWDPKTGVMLADYAADRTAMLEKLRKGGYK